MRWLGVSTRHLAHPAPTVVMGDGCGNGNPAFVWLLFAVVEFLHVHQKVVM